jgi:hypothetical protein
MTVPRQIQISPVINSQDHISPRALPMTRDAFSRLAAEADRLVEHLPRLQAEAREHGVSGDPGLPTVLAAGDLHLASRRLEMLRRVLEDAEVVEPDGRARAADHHMGERFGDVSSVSDQEEEEMMNGIPAPPSELWATPPAG